ncbi:hypothetical protein [Nostoc sp.]|uniref:hypothetical protein n=1 Tax=Nostoc sp. TaxID=1180 RepID=UPI002FFC6688
MQKAEVTVHIWRPMEFNLDGRNVDKKKQGGYVDRYKSSNVLNDMLDTFLSEWRRFFGHSSLSVNLANYKPIYLSFWPKNDDFAVVSSAFGNKKFGWKKQESIFRKTLYEDAFYMSAPPKGETFENSFSIVSNQKQINSLPPGKGIILTLPDGNTEIFSDKLVYPDENIQLLLPDGEAIYQYVSSLTKTKKEYDLFDSNCSTFVTSALKEGTRSLKSDHLANIMGAFRRSEEALKLVGIFSALFSEQGKQSPSMAIHQVKSFVETQGLSLPTSLASIVEIQGKETPNTVKRYVEQLKKNISQRK